MNKVVLLAPYFLPRRRVGAWRPFKFAIHLKKYGWDPHVITIRETKETLTEKEKALLADIPIYKIKSPFDFTHRLNNGFAYSGFSKNDKEVEEKSSSLSPKSIINWVDKQIPIDSWLPLFILRKNYVTNIIRDIQPDMLWSTGDPWSSHWLGSKIVESLHIPWVADFRDPWTLGDVNLKNRSKFSFQADQKEEKKVLKKATACTFNAKRTAILYDNAYDHLEIDSTTVYNCYDSTLFNDTDTTVDAFKDDTLNLVFFGKFRPLSPITPFINLLEKIYKVDADAARRIRMYSFDKLEEKDQALAKEKGVLDNLSVLEHQPLEDTLPYLTQADALWLSTHPKRKNIIPAKLWDYLAAKRPIISIAPNPEIEGILNQTKAGIQINPDDTTALVNLLIQCVEAKQANRAMPIPVSFDDKAIKQYDAEVVTGQLVDIFDRLT